jgi:hypothetical protein
MTLDWATLLALAIAAVSVVVSALVRGNPAVTFRHVCVLLLPLAAIAWPEFLDGVFRHARSGYVHGGEGPAPALLVRIAAWILLSVIVVVHHIVGI